jgi:TetR/AcrR family transcriptional regulator
MSPRTRDPAATRAAILAAAEEVILARGFARASTSAIAAKAGVTKSLLHHHFGSKEGLWREVKRRRFAAYADEQMRLLDDAGPAPELLRESIAFYFRFLRDNPQFVRILAWIYLERLDDAGDDLSAELTDRGVASLQAAQEAGLLRRDLDPRLLLFAFIGGVQHWFQNREFYRQRMGAELDDDALDEAFLATFQKIFMEGVLPR